MPSQQSNLHLPPYRLIAPAPLVYVSLVVRVPCLKILTKLREYHRSPGIHVGIATVSLTTGAAAAGLGFISLMPCTSLSSWVFSTRTKVSIRQLMVRIGRRDRELVLTCQYAMHNSTADHLQNIRSSNMTILLLFLISTLAPYHRNLLKHHGDRSMCLFLTRPPN